MAELNWAELIERKFEVVRVTRSDEDRGIKIGDCVKLKHAGTRSHLGIFELKDGKDWVLLHCQVKVIIEELPKKSFADIINWGDLKIPDWAVSVAMSKSGSVVVGDTPLIIDSTDWIRSDQTTGNFTIITKLNPADVLESWDKCILKIPIVMPDQDNKTKALEMKRKPPFPPINVNVLWHPQYGFECNFRKNGISGARLLQLIASGNKTLRHPNEFYLEAYDNGEWISGDGLVYKRETQD